MSREITEEDFRMPEFRGAKVEDYELRGDGKPVRKDRWERAVRSLVEPFGFSMREFDIDDVVKRATRIAEVAKVMDSFMRGKQICFRSCNAVDAQWLLYVRGTHVTPLESDDFDWMTVEDAEENGERILS